MDKYVLDGIRLENGDFTEEERKISLYSQKIYNDSNIKLNDFELSILDKIKSDGIAICHINDYDDDGIKEKFNVVKDYYAKFKNDSKIQNRIREYYSGKSFNSGKDFEINSTHYLNRNLNLGDGIVEFFLSEPFLNLASSYYGKSPKSFQFNTWIHLSRLKEISPISSMNWHRDPEALRIFKIFLVVDDIDQTNGPFQYVKGSHIDGRYSSLQEYRISARYPDKDFIEKKVNKDDIVSLTGKSGTIAFVDSFGFHRGGCVKNGLRLLSQAVFLKPEVINLPIWKNNRMNLDLDNPIYQQLSPLAKYTINNKF